METDVYLNEVMENFSGYIAVDEVYDGPFCIITIEDSHNDKRLILRVLDHNPTFDDITEILKAFDAILVKRHLAQHGVTTDGKRAPVKKHSTAVGVSPI